MSYKHLLSSFCECSNTSGAWTYCLLTLFSGKFYHNEQASTGQCTSVGRWVWLCLAYVYFIERLFRNILKFLDSVKFQCRHHHVFIFSHENTCFQILYNFSNSKNTRRKISILWKMYYFLASCIWRLEDTLMYMLAMLLTCLKMQLLRSMNFYC